MNGYSIMEYLYRDANNFKAWGNVLLLGEMTSSYIDELRPLLDYGEYFVAEQVDIPVLYEQLWKYSNGPTCTDHTFHEFFRIRPASDDDLLSSSIWGDVTHFMEKFRDTKGQWDCAKSIHCSF